jgi:hypothetical protein
MVLDLIELNSNTSIEICIEFQCHSTIELKLLNSIQKNGMQISEKYRKIIFVNIMLKKNKLTFSHVSLLENELNKF